MARNYAEIAFTPSVKAVQTQQGSRDRYQGFEALDAPVPIGPAEAAFISERDSFYQATVSETGWPYVQYRGGPAGFLSVLDERTIAYPDFRGNMQYLSVGNIHVNERVALILMDYANRRRLKIAGRVRIVHEADDPALLARVALPSYRARVERAIVIDIEALDWNCPMHITPRFTQIEVDGMVGALTDRIAELENALQIMEHEE